MADLEDKILKQNIPGRWSTHDDNETGFRDCDDEDNAVDNKEDQRVEQGSEEDLLQYARKLNMDEVPESISRSILAERMKQHNTGVKGVLADYRASVAMDREEQISKQAHRQAVLTRMAEGYKLRPDDVAQEDVAVQPNVDGDDDNESDDEFMREYRQKRIQELKQAKSRKLFGNCIDVNGDSFLLEVDTEEHDVLIVVHLYEPSVQCCLRMNKILEQISVGMPNVKFLRMKAGDNGVSIDRMTMPILNIYKAGESVVVLAGIMQELGEFFSKDDVEWLLESTFQSNGLHSS